MGAQSLESRVGTYYLPDQEAVTSAQMPFGFDRVEVVTAAVIAHLKEKGIKGHEVLTLTGSSGTAGITAGGLTKTATFATSLTQTADNFVTNYAAEYLTLGITVTANAGILTFASTKVELDVSIANATLTLDGTVVGVALNKHNIAGETLPIGFVLYASTEFTEITLTSGSVTLE